MVGYEMLAQAQRDLTAEQVSNKLNVGSESDYDIYSVFTSQIETLTSIRQRAYFSSPCPGSIGMLIGLVHHFCIVHDREM